VKNGGQKVSKPPKDRGGYVAAVVFDQPYEGVKARQRAGVPGQERLNPTAPPLRFLSTTTYPDFHSEWRSSGQIVNSL